MRQYLKLFIVCVGLMMIVQSCTIKAPRIPKWEVQMTVPLINKSYPVIDLARDENISVNEENAFMYFHSEGVIEGADISEEDIKISPDVQGTGDIPLVENFTESLALYDESDEEDAQIFYGEISQGELLFEFTNVPENVSSVQIYFYELYDSNRTNITLTIPRRAPSFLERYNLKDHILWNEAEEAVLDDLTFEVTLYSGGTTIPVGGYMRVFYDQFIYFDYIIGLLNNFKIDADDNIVDVNVDYPHNIENAIDLNEPLLTFSITSYIGFETTFYATVTSYNTRSNISETIYVTRLVNPAEPNIPLLSIIELTKEDGVDVLINIAPDRIEVTESYFVVNNPDNGFGFAAVGTALEGDYVNTVPFNFTFTAGETVRPAELTEVEILEDNREEIRDRAKKAIIKMTLHNYYSVGAMVNIFFCSDPDESKLYVHENENSDAFSRLVFLGSFMPRGSHLQATEDDFYFEIEEDDLGIFYKYETIYVGFEFDFEAGETVIHPEETIVVRGNIAITVLVEL